MSRLPDPEGWEVGLVKPLVDDGWIKTSDRKPGLARKVLAIWRPVDHEERPWHRDMVIGHMTVHGPDGYEPTTDDPKYWWANGRYYDGDVHITHWMELPPFPKK